jgi:peptidoglycan/LPS O-acetylase OafA/YrhL
MGKLNNKSHLDGIRGLAVIFVVLSHLSNEGLNIHEYLNFSGSGKYGVFLFFVLSAFLLAKVQLESSGKGLPYIALYAKRRFLRIYPLYFLVLVACAGITGFDYGSITTALSAEDVLKHLLLQQGNDLFWTVPVEFTFYIILPFIVGFIIHLDKARTGLGGIFLILAIFASNYLWPRNDYPINGIELYPYIILFLTGILVAWVDSNRYRLINNNAYGYIIEIIGWGSLIAVLTTIPFYYAFLSGGKFIPDQFHKSYPLFSLLWGLVLFALTATNGPLRAVFSSNILVYIGKISFSVYLIHWTVIKSINHFFMNYAESTRMVGIILLTLLLSSLTYRFVEYPMYRLAHKRQLQHLKNAF